MYEFGDYRKSRFYLESREEGVVEGKAKGKAEMLQENIGRLESRGYDAGQISDLLAVDIKVVKKILESHSS